MDKRIYTGLMLLTMVFQVACGKSKKDKALDAFLQQCNTKACTDMYTNAANNAGIAPLAAQAGLPQVTAVGATTQSGQVPSTAVLPASAAQVNSTAAKIQSQIQALNAQETAKNVIVSSASSEPTQVEIGVTRLNSTVSVSSTPETLVSRSVSSLPTEANESSAAPAESPSSGVAAGR